MSLWLQAVLEDLQCGDYKHLRERILPLAPIRIPSCLIRELEFAERRCRDYKKDPLFPIRFLWLMEAHEQGMFGLSPSGRSLYNPEELLNFWQRAIADNQYQQECEAKGIRFDFVENAVKLDAGWIYIGKTFVEDFLEIESTLGVELLFPNPPNSKGRPVFQEFKKPKSSGSNPANPN